MPFSMLYMRRLWIFKYLKLTFPWFYAIIYARFIYTLGGNARALEKFGAMTEEEKRQVLEAARSARSKEEIRSLVRDVAEL